MNKHSYLSVFLIVFLFVTLSPILKIIPVVKASPAYEDFTDGWTEVDPGQRINFTQYHIDHLSLRKEKSYFYKSYGTDYFDDFEHLLDVRTDFQTLYGWGSIWMIADTYGSVLDLQSANEPYIAIQLYRSATKTICIREHNGSGVAAFSNNLYILENTWYYLRIKKDALAMTCRVWTDSSDRDNNDVEASSYVGENSLTLDFDYSFEYLIACNTLGTGTSEYPINNDIDNLDLQEEEDIPQAYNISPENNYISQHGEEISFSVLWNTSSTNLDWCGFSWNISGAWSANETLFNNAGVTEKWGNITKTLTGIGQDWVWWKQYCNNTNADENYTSVRLFHWELLPSVSRHIAGQSEGGSRWHGAIYYNGSREAIYTCYTNSSFDPWRYEVNAFDLGYANWTGSCYIANAASNDPHYNPVISVLPDGHLIVMYGYWVPQLTFRISTYDADDEANLTKLCSYWSSAYTVRAESHSDYPMSYRWDDVLLVTFRDGGAPDGDLGYYQWKTNQIEELWVTSNTSDYTDWTVSGTQPYLNDSDDWIRSTMTDEQQGHFLFHDFWGWNYTNLKTYLKIYSITSSSCDVYIYNGSWINLGNLAGTGWKTFNITLTLNTIVELNNAKVYFKKTGTIPTNLTKMYIEVNYTGFSGGRKIALKDDNYKSPYYPYGNVFGDNLVLSSTLRNSSDEIDALMFIYSDDKGESWKFINGTTITTPANLTDVKVLDFDCEVHSGAPVIDDGAVYVSLMAQNGSTFTRVAVYEAGLGSTGSWTSDTVKYENGTVINGTFLIQFYDTYYNRSSGWGTINPLDEVVKLVRIPTSNYTYRIVHTDPLSDNVEMDVAHYFASVLHPPQAYEALTREYHVGALSYLTIGGTQETADNSTLYGVKLTATENCSLNGIKIYGWKNQAYETWKAGLYNSTFHLISNTTVGSHATLYPVAHWFVAPSFINYSEIVVGQEYWLVWRTSMQNGNCKWYYDAGATNQSFTFDLEWTDELPSQLNEGELTFYDRKYSIKAFPSFLVVRGLGVDEWATAPYYIGTNISGVIDEDSWGVFHTQWRDNSGLDAADFYWNVTGVILYNGTVDLNPGGGWVGVAWSNFTRALPDEGMVVMWWINASDIYGNQGNTTEQYVTLKFETVLDQFGQVIHQIQILSLEAWNWLRQHTITQFFSVATIYSFQIDMIPNINALFTITSLKSWAFNLSGEITEIFTVVSFAVFAVILNLLGAVAVAISIAAQTTFEFTLNSFINPLFTVTGLYMEGVIQNVYGQVATLLTVKATETFGQVVHGLVTLQTTVLGSRLTSLTFNVDVIHIFTVNSATFSYGNIIDVWAVISQAITVASWNSLTPLTYATTGFVLAAMVVGLFICIPLLAIIAVIIWRR